MTDERPDLRPQDGFKPPGTKDQPYPKKKKIKGSLGVLEGMFATGLVVFPCHPGLFKKLVVTVTFPDNSFAGEWGCNVIYLPN